MIELRFRDGRRHRVSVSFPLSPKASFLYQDTIFRKSPDPYDVLLEPDASRVEVWYEDVTDPSYLVG